jgi:putative transposase
MLNEEEFQRWCEQCGVGEQTRAVINQIRAAPPARRVRSAAGNVSGRYPSRKMAVTIQFESHRNELAGIYEMEHTATVLEYYDQPPAIRLIYAAATGRRVSVAHTPDFFVLRTDGAGWEEWKTAADLERLGVQSPQRYQQTAGRWRCPPGEQYAAALGLAYRLRSAAEVDWIYQRNLRFLEE